MKLSVKTEVQKWVGVYKMTSSVLVVGTTATVFVPHKQKMTGDDSKILLLLIKLGAGFLRNTGK